MPTIKPKPGNAPPAAEDLDLYAKRATTIDPLDLRREYVTMPADLAHWNARLADAMEERAKAELSLERTEARLARTHRAKLEYQGRKATEAAVRELLHDDQRWVDARVQCIETDAEEARVKGVVRAVEAKKEMLVSLGAHIRKEMDHSPSVRREQRAGHEDAGGGHDWKTD